MSMEPPNYELLDKEKTREMMEVFKGERTGWVFVGPKKWFFPYRYVGEAKEYYNFKVRSDDTWIITFPRSGTTWTQELIWLLSNNLDYETAKTKPLIRRFPFLEHSIMHHPDVAREFLEFNNHDPEKQKVIRELASSRSEVIAGMPSPRFIKSHFPLSLHPNILDSGCKIVYVARNPKDVAVSYYHLSRSLKYVGYIGDFARFWDYFENNLISWAPYWEHLKEAWANKDHPNLLFIFYEEMQQDYLKTVKKVAKFLGKSYTDEQMNEVAEFLNIKNFRNNPMVNGTKLKELDMMEGEFIRKGQCGGWKEYFTPQLNDRANKWIENNLKGTDLSFPDYKDGSDLSTANAK